MKIRCIHGYFLFEEEQGGEISQFMSLFGVELVAVENYYTFAKLAEAKDYAIIGGTYLGAPVTKTYEGKPWEIMRENKLIYHFNNDIVQPIDTITDTTDIKQSGSYFLARGLIIPGALLNGTRIKSYSGFYVFDQQKFKYTEVSDE